MPTSRVPTQARCRRRCCSTWARDTAWSGIPSAASTTRESSEQVAAKFFAAKAAGLTPILCVGESLHEREAGQTEWRIEEQLEPIFALGGAQALDRAIIAYEPVWAIGTGRTASPEQAQAVHAFIRGEIAARDAKIAGSLPILYGGSVKPDNAAALFSQPDVDGGLVGGASLVARDFLAIAAAATGVTSEFFQMQLMTILNVVYVLLAIAMIALILMQRGAGAQAGSGFGAGASATVFGSRGAGNFLSKSTKYLAIVFFGISMFMAWHATNGAAAPTPEKQDLGLMSEMPAAPAANASRADCSGSAGAGQHGARRSPVAPLRMPRRACRATPRARSRRPHSRNRPLRRAVDPAYNIGLRIALDAEPLPRWRNW